MAHLVDTMAYTGAVPWHGLGNSVDPTTDIDGWIQQSGLTWRVNESPIFYVANGQPVKADGHKGLVRSDTNDFFGTVTDRYKIVQPRDVLEFFRDLSDAGDLRIETAGSLKGGRVVWALAKGHRPIEVGSDRTHPYALLSTGFNGQATHAHFTSVRVVCNNTLSLSRGDRASGVSIPHSTTFDPENVKEQLGLIDDLSTEFEAHLNKLADTVLDEPKVVELVTEWFGQHDGNGKLTAQSKNTCKEVYRSIKRSPGADLDTCQVYGHPTAYGVLQGVTNFVDFNARARSQDNRLHSSWFGKGREIKSLAFDSLMKVAA